MSAYLGMPVLGIALLGLALAYMFYIGNAQKATVGFAGGLEDE